MRLSTLGLLLVVVSTVGVAACGTSTPVVLTAEHREAIASALREAKLPAASSVEIADSGRVVVTFLVDDAALSQMVMAGITSPQEFATKAVITVRNAMLPFKIADSYRVTLNGPPPGPGLVMRYGSARFSEGGAVKWEPGTGAR